MWPSTVLHSSLALFVLVSLSSRTNAVSPAYLLIATEAKSTTLRVTWVADDRMKITETYKTDIGTFRLEIPHTYYKAENEKGMKRKVFTSRITKAQIAAGSSGTKSGKCSESASIDLSSATRSETGESLCGTVGGSEVCYTYIFYRCECENGRALRLAVTDYRGRFLTMGEQDDFETCGSLQNKVDGSEAAKFP